ncbi:MAG: hypothetical protein KatS3mg119_0664 [Rhodothalassiaceae bacterium]|nr:MAG: hypothetical protein KatS3mg119_0664 [Rhodothalassiaceae bacterium]
MSYFAIRNPFEDISPQMAQKAIREYNSGYFLSPSVPNVKLDQEGREKFRKADLRNPHSLADTLWWITTEYGGIMRRPPIFVETCCNLIAENIMSSEGYIDSLLDMPPLKDTLPDMDTITEIMRPFHALIPNESSYFAFTAATKWLHFSRPDIFIPLDSRARRFYRLPASNANYNAKHYHATLSIIRDVIIGKIDKINLDALKQADKFYMGDIKLLDKIAYTLGGRKK